jgi:hypothetical protein
VGFVGLRAKNKKIKKRFLFKRINPNLFEHKDHQQPSSSLTRITPRDTHLGEPPDAKAPQDQPAASHA